MTGTTVERRAPLAFRSHGGVPSVMLGAGTGGGRALLLSSATFGVAPYYGSGPCDASSWPCV
ncbi:MAG: hypothetical protein ACRD0A_03115 [Acidimicrobiales bacterium]